MENNKEFLLANVKDKIELAKKRNKIQNTVFYTEQEQALIIKELKILKEQNYFFFGGFEEAERKSLITYPEKFSEEIARSNLNTIIKAIEIKLPNELFGKFIHSDYLGSLMKLGLERERFGDIIVFDNEAYIIVLNENAEYIKENLKLLTRFKKADISVIGFEKIKVKPKEFEDIKIVIASNRLDNFVSELYKCSRSKSEELIIGERVLVNGITEIKISKQLKIGDILTIRGKGKFIISEFNGNNKKGKDIYLLKKYI